VAGASGATRASPSAFPIGAAELSKPDATPRSALGAASEPTEVEATEAKPSPEPINPKAVTSRMLDEPDGDRVVNTAR
jgi:hypothetical protein